MNSKKLAIASAMALMFAGAAHAVDISAVDATQDSVLALTGLTGVLGTTVDVTALSGAINTAVVNGAIDISGINVSLSSMASNVSATANVSTGSTNAEAYAIAGAKLSTTVIGAMNSATVDVMAKVTEQSDKTQSSLGVGGLASQGGDIAITGNNFGAGQLGLDTTGAAALAATGTALQMDLSNLTNTTLTDASNKVSELQSMNVFNTAINTATLDAGIKIAAAVDTNAWFLNPQTGVVNLSNIAMTTTAIGAMNSSITRLGANLAK